MASSSQPARIGIIGGSGLYEIHGLQEVRSHQVQTPFGPPSDELVTAIWESKPVVFLPRHGRGHRIAPHEINHRANLWALKSLGARLVLGVSAVGSLQEKYKPLDIVLPDQFIDRTKKSSEHTFFGKGIVAHVAFSDPICKNLQGLLHQAAQAVLPGRIHLNGAYVNMEGPAFSTRAESNMYRQLGGDVIGMTKLAEAKLAREAEICYAALSMVTDYDCWKTDEEPVTVQMIIERLHANSESAKKILARALPSIDPAAPCACQRALANSIVTARNLWPEETFRNLEPILRPYA